MGTKKWDTRNRRRFCTKRARYACTCTRIYDLRSCVSPTQATNAEIQRTRTIYRAMHFQLHGNSPWIDFLETKSKANWFTEMSPRIFYVNHTKLPSPFIIHSLYFSFSPISIVIFITIGILRMVNLVHKSISN